MKYKSHNEYSVDNPSPIGNELVTDEWNSGKIPLTKTEKRIKLNSSKYGKRIKQLKVIVDDEDYIPVESVNSYHGFIRDMYLALIGGRPITPKMESAITKIVKTYAKHLKKEADPIYRRNKLDYIEATISKLNMIKRRLEECNYTTGYKNDKLYFLDSIEKQVYSRGSLSIKQRKALNGMYEQFIKKIEKNTKLEKK